MNNPMMLFLSDTLVEMFTSLMNMVIKQIVLNDATTALKLVEINMAGKENQLDVVSIKICTVLKEVLSVLSATDVKI